MGLSAFSYFFFFQVLTGSSTKMDVCGALMTLQRRIPSQTKIAQSVTPFSTRECCRLWTNL